MDPLVEPPHRFVYGWPPIYTPPAFNEEDYAYEVLSEDEEPVEEEQPSGGGPAPRGKRRVTPQARRQERVRRKEEARGGELQRGSSRVEEAAASGGSASPSAGGRPRARGERAADPSRPSAPGKAAAAFSAPYSGEGPPQRGAPSSSGGGGPARAASKQPRGGSGPAANDASDDDAEPAAVVNLEVVVVPAGGSIGEGGVVLDESGTPVVGADGEPVKVMDPNVPAGGSIGPGGVILDAGGKPVVGKDGKPVTAQAPERPAAAPASVASSKASSGGGKGNAAAKKGGKKGKAAAGKKSAAAAAEEADKWRAAAGDCGGVNLEELKEMETALQGRPRPARGGGGGSAAASGDAPAEEAAAAVWDPFASPCWAPRASWCDAKSLIDTEEIEKVRFNNDWQRVRIELGLEKTIVRADDDGAADLDGDGIPDEVQEVEEVCWEFNQALVVLFGFYAAFGAVSSGDVSFLSLNTWTQFVTDFAIVQPKSKFCKQSDIDTLFVSIDSNAARLQQQHLKEEEDARQGAHSKAKSEKDSKDARTAKYEDKKQKFSKVEFTTALVQIAIKRHIETGEMSDVSDAFARFMSETILTRLKAPHQPPNTFRLRHLYKQEVDAVLVPRLPTLRNVFDGLVSRGKLRRAKLLSLVDWLGFLRAANLTGLDASERDAALCFVWSRMRVGDERTESGHSRDECLPFEGFLEAFCRLAVLKCLPTDAELEASKAPNAAVHLAEMRLNDEEGYRNLLESRARPFGAEPTAKMPLHRSIEHLCAMLVHAVAEDPASAEVSAVDMTRWQEKVAPANSKQ